MNLPRRALLIVLVGALCLPSARAVSPRPAHSSGLLGVLDHLTADQKSGRYAQGEALVTAALGRFSQPNAQKSLRNARASLNVAWALSLARSRMYARARARYRASLADPFPLDPDRLKDLVALGRAFRSGGEQDEAARCQRRAFIRFRTIHEQGGEAAALSELGLAEYARSRYQPAFEALLYAAACARAAGDPDLEGETLNNLGLAFRAFGLYDRATRCFAQARALDHARNRVKDEADALSNEGSDDFDLGQYRQAALCYRQALSILRRLGARRDAAAALLNLGYASFYRKDYPRAVDDLTQALTQYRALPDRPGRAVALEDLAWVRDRQRRYGDALRLQRQSLVLSRSIGDRETEGLGLMKLGQIELAQGQGRSAIGELDAGYVVLHAAGNPTPEAEACHALMLAWAAQSRPRLAIFWGKQAVRDYQSIRAHVRPLGAKAEFGFVQSHAETYRRLADLLIREGRLPEAEQTLSLLKRDELDEYERGSRILVRGSRILVRGSRILVRAGQTPDQTGPTPTEARWAARLRAAREPAVTRVLLARLPAAFVPMSSERPTLPPDARRPPGPGVAIIWTLVGSDRYRVILTTARGQITDTSSISGGALREAVFQFRRTLGRPDTDPRTQARRLYNTLIGPRITAALHRSGATTLLWSLDDALRYLPPAALNDGHDYLISRWRCVVFNPALPSPSPVQAAAAPRRVLGLGVSQAHTFRDPATGEWISFPPLPDVPKELHRIIRDPAADPAALLPGHILLDRDFTAASLRHALRDKCPLVHIAGHFRLNPGNDANSALLLGDGTLLTLAELEWLSRPFAGVDLLTLSACDTATGAGGDGREIDGFAAVARQGGARAVLASLWPVADDGTQALMRAFYHCLARPGVPPAAALRQAQLALLRGPTFRHPYYWASFVLLGDRQH